MLQHRTLQVSVSFTNQDTKHYTYLLKYM
jgi:hypothetical protein